MSILIKHGLVFDGTGASGRRCDVLIQDGRVARLSEQPLDPAAADEVIDARGHWVMPGFLDTHTHYDAEILGGPGLKESVRHGVTTVCMGSCSLSTILSSPEDCADFFSRVEALPHEQVLPVLRAKKSWSTPAGYIDGLERLALGPNVACFLGHSDMRTAAMGLGRAVDPAARPDKAELKKMTQHLEDALDAGFLGMSSMTNPWDKVGGDRYRSSKLPSTYATWREYRHFHKILRRRGRILQSAPNITTKVNVFAFLAESAGFGLRDPLKVTLISAADTKADPWLSDAVRTGTRWFNTLMRGNLRWQTVPMPFEVYADGMDLVVFEEFGAGEAALHLADELERNALLVDKNYRRQFRKDYEKRWSPRVWHRDLYDAVIVSAPDEAIIGRSFGEVGDDRGIHPVDAFLDLVVEFGTQLRWKTTIANHRPDKLVRLASDPNMHVSFADSGAHVRNMAFYNFALYYLRMIKDAEEAGDPVLPMAQAIHKVTGELADWYGLDAGHLKPGGRADITIINPDGLNSSLDDYHEAPMTMFTGLNRMVRRNDDAVRATIIAGELVYKGQGVFAEGFGAQRRYGSFLKHGDIIAPATASSSQRPRSEAA